MAAAAAVASHTSLSLSPNSDLDLDPPQCSIWFDPKEWSKRYAETFFTAQVVSYHLNANGLPLFEFQMRCGALNTWKVDKTVPQIEEFAKTLSADLQAHNHTVRVPELPAKKWTLLSEDVTPEYLTQRVTEFDRWLHSLMSTTKKIASFPTVRAFLELDRQLIKEPEPEYDDEEDEPLTEEQKAAMLGD